MIPIALSEKETANVTMTTNAVLKNTATNELRCGADLYSGLSQIDCCRKPIGDGVASILRRQSYQAKRSMKVLESQRGRP